MFPTLLALTVALSAPGQFRQMERKPRFLPPYEELDTLCHEVGEIETRLSRELTRVAKLCMDLLNREEEASFQRRLSLLRDFVRVADEAARLAISRKERFDQAYQRNPLKVARDVFEDSQRAIVRLRAGSRFLIYGEIATHRWPGERSKRRPFANARLLNSVAKAFGMENEIEKFMYGMADIEIWATDQYQSVAGGLELLLKSASKPPSLPRPSQP